jgi:hypothetical protein
MDFLAVNRLGYAPGLSGSAQQAPKAVSGV